MPNFHSNGKLLITAEYLVLDGALSLALPTKHGQSLMVEPHDENKLIWKSFDEKGRIWFEETFDFSEILLPSVFNGSMGHYGKSRLNDVGKTLLQILTTANQINESFLAQYIDSKIGLRVTTQLDFPNNWGLGTSSTLINNIASWAQVDPYQLLEKTFGGSGYDIACAQHNAPILFQLIHGKPTVEEIAFCPPFKDCLYFVYLNKKQNSREAIANYRNNNSDLSQEISEINAITKKIGRCTDLIEFRALIDSHESIISKIIHQKPIKERLFPNFDGSIKSLGAWGGDFILVTSKNDPSGYFKEKGFNTVLKYSDLGH